MFIGVLRGKKELTTEDMKEILHKGHRGGFIYGKDMELTMEKRRKVFRLYIVLIAYQFLYGDLRY